MQNAANQYTLAANKVQAAPSYTARLSQTNSKSYYTVMDAGPVHPGDYANFLPATQDTEENLGTLATGGSVEMNLYSFTKTDPWTAGNPYTPGAITNSNGTLFEIVTVAGGTEIVEQTPHSTVPVPPSVLLLAPGFSAWSGSEERSVRTELHWPVDS